ncbi:hypothetical protein ACLCDV_08160 [Sphingobacterium sp. Lzh-3]|uniref:hypothetical protein n=1 Tax=Sphingobacterium sp. Lzh-3 TaxID=3382150 RepID=UPI00398D29F3
MVTIKEFREKWAKRKGFDDWSDVLNTVAASTILLTNIIDEVATKYAILVGKESLKNANLSFEKHYYFENYDHQFTKDKIKELITQDSNIPVSLGKIKKA